MSKVTLLCRGESLGSINLLPRTKHSVVVNAFHFELEDENVHNYVKGCSDVNHVVSAGAHTAIMRNSGIYKKYNLITTLGGNLSSNSEEFISKLFEENLLDKIETRLVVCSLKEARHH